MPDLDRIDDSLGAGWRSSYDLVSGRIASPAEIIDKLIKSLAKELRDGSGVPSLEIAYSILGPDDMNSILRSFRDLDALVKVMEGHRHTRIAVEVAKSKLAFWNTITRYPPIGVTQLNGIPGETKVAPIPLRSFAMQVR